MKNLRVETTRKLLQLLKMLFDLTNGVGFRKVAPSNLCRQLHLSNKGIKFLSEFLIEDENHPKFFRWAKPDCEPTLIDATKLHEAILNEQRPKDKKYKKTKSEIVKNFKSNTLNEEKMKPLNESMSLKSSLSEYSVNQLIDELERRNFRGTIKISF